MQEITAMASGLLRLRLAGLARRVSLPLSEKWRQVYGPNSTHFVGDKAQWGILQWFSISGYAAMMLGAGLEYAVAEDVSMNENNGDINNSRADISNGTLRRIDPGEVISNVHTARWRVFTNKGQELFSDGKLDEAEKYFLSALDEAKEGFGVLDPHVASACHNLAELYRMKRMFEKAEPLYLEAIELLELSLGPEDVRVGFALHNLGGFYLMQRKLEQARICYERALKIKRRILGLNHPDYANTMFHLGEVLRLQGNQGDAEVLIRDSIRILEESRLGQSQLTIQRMGHLAQMLLESNQVQEAENLQRKILHILEVTKGWDSLNTVAVAEQLAMTIQALGNLNEAQELLKRCLEVRQNLLQENHIQVGATMLKLAQVGMLKAGRHRLLNASEAMLELENAKALLNDAIRIAGVAMQFSEGAKGDDGPVHNNPGKEEENGHAALLILMQSFNALGQLEISMLELHQATKKDSGEDITKAEEAVRQCISIVKKTGIPEHILKSAPIKKEYVSCLQHLTGLLSRTSIKRDKQVKQELRQLNKEIMQIEAELGQKQKKHFF